MCRKCVKMSLQLVKMNHANVVFQPKPNILLMTSKQKRATNLIEWPISH